MRTLGFELVIPKGVYSPREDTFLLAANIPSGKRVLELGCGSGLVSLCASRKADTVLGIDINPLAIECARANAEKNKVMNCKFMESNLFSNVRGLFDVILFNAPYLPRADRFDDGIEALAWCGGKTGRETVSYSIKECADFLAPEGTVALVISSITGLEQVLALLKENSFSPSIAAREKIAFEELYCIHAKKGRNR